MKIISKRAREALHKKNNQRRLEEQFQLSQKPLSEEDQERIRRVFDAIRRQLGA